MSTGNAAAPTTNQKRFFVAVAVVAQHCATFDVSLVASADIVGRLKGVLFVSIWLSQINSYGTTTMTTRNLAKRLTIRRVQAYADYIIIS